MVKINQKWVFLKAFILAVLILILGLYAGYSFEKWRTAYIKRELIEIEFEWMDYDLLGDFYSLEDPFKCDEAIQDNIRFADYAYERIGQKIGRYEKANELTQELELSKKRYILLKLRFWLNSIDLKQKCNASYLNVVYFFTDEPTIAQTSKQQVISTKLFALKKEYGSELMLIPLSVSLNITTIDKSREKYNLTEIPCILINEETIITDLQDIDKIKEMLSST